MQLRHFFIIKPYFKIIIMENSKIVVFFTTPTGNANQPFFTGIYTDPTGTAYPFALWKQTSTNGTVYFKGSTKGPNAPNANEPVTADNIDALREYNAEIQMETDKTKNVDNSTDSKPPF